MHLITSFCLECIVLLKCTNETLHFQHTVGIQLRPFEWKKNIHCTYLLTNGDSLQVNQVCKLLVIFNASLLSLIQTDTEYTDTVTDTVTERYRQRETDTEKVRYSYRVRYREIDTREMIWYYDTVIIKKCVLLHCRSSNERNRNCLKRAQQVRCWREV